MAHRDMAYWNHLASTYDEGPDHGLLAPRTRAAWSDLLLAHLPPSPADIVDLGCGTGTLSVLLAENGYRIRGLDSASNMLEEARNKAAAASLGAPLTFSQGDAADPPYAAQSCDVVLVRHVLWALADPEAAVSRWRSLLRPGGRMVLIEGTWHTGGGVSATECQRLLSLHTSSVAVHPLADPELWGGPLTDDRYLATGTL